MKLASLSGRHVVVIAFLGLMSTGCRNMNHAQEGAALGSGLGAITGAIIGHQTGNRDAGALIGAVAGGLGGAVLGDAEDMAEERDAAIVHAHHVEMARRRDRIAMTNRDVINMYRKGVSDQLIINTMQHRGGRFDTSPDAIIQLKEYQISDPIIQAMQQYGSTR